MEYVTLQEGARLTGKSEMTIRRLTKKPGARPNTRKDADQRLYISLPFLYKHYPAKDGLKAITRTFEEAPKEGITQPTGVVDNSKSEFVQPEQPIQPIQEFEQQPEKEHKPDIVRVLEEQNKELKADKLYLQNKLDEASRQVSRLEERTNYLLLQSNAQPEEGKPAQEQQAQPGKGIRSADPILIAAIIVLVAALIFVMVVNK